jgi:hypothetical protein
MMVENRVHDLEVHVADLRVSNAKLSVCVDHLTKEVHSLSGLVATLNDTIAKGQGALYVIGGIGVAVGALVHWALDFFQGSHK